MPGFGRFMTVGAKLGLFAGTIFAAVYSLRWSTASHFWTVVPGTVAVLAPAFLIFGSVIGLVLCLTRRVSRMLYRIILWVLPLLWLCVLFVCGGELSPEGYWVSTRSALVVLIIGIVSFAALRALVTVLVRGLARELVTTILIVTALAWLASVGFLLIHDAHEGFPANVQHPLSGQPNVLLIVLDTVRADHLSCYDYHRKTTPNIDAFAAEARLYKNVLSPSPWTLPSHASFFTGLPSSGHGCSYAYMALHEDFETLAEQLKAAGYQTVGLSSNLMVTERNGFAQGFELFGNPGRHPVCSEGLAERLLRRLGLTRMGTMDANSHATIMHRQLARWFREDYRPYKPFFIFLNYIEAHGPYIPPSHRLEWSMQDTFDKWAKVDQVWDYIHPHMLSGLDLLSNSEISELTTLYDEEIAYLDRKVGSLLEFLRSSGLDENTLIIITSDHGEHFGEHHMMDHQFSVYEQLVRVPLIVKYRDRFAAGEDKTLIQSHDIYPTILELADIKWERQDAHNCRSLLHPDDNESRLGIAEYLWPFMSGISRFQSRWAGFDVSRFMRRLRAVQVGDMKLIHASKGNPELYNLAKDPWEMHDRFEKEPEMVTKLEQMLDEWLHSFKHYEPPPINGVVLRRIPQEDVDALRGLGYVR